MRQGRRADGHSHASSADMGDDGCSRRSGEASTEALLNQGDFPGLNRCGDSAPRRGSRTHPMARYESRGRNIRRAGRTRPTELTLGNRATTARTGCCEPRRAWNPADGVGRRLWTGATAGGEAGGGVGAESYIGTESRSALGVGTEVRLGRRDAGMEAPEALRASETSGIWLGGPLTPEIPRMAQISRGIWLDSGFARKA